MKTAIEKAALVTSDIWKIAAWLQPREILLDVVLRDRAQRLAEEGLRELLDGRMSRVDANNEEKRAGHDYADTQ